MKTPREFYQAIIDNKSDYEHINWILNQALRDPVIASSKSEDYNYQYLCTVAKSFGFTFIDHWQLIKF